MTAFGYTLMCEQSRPDDLVRDARRAEEAGFEFSVMSDPQRARGGKALARGRRAPRDAQRGVAVAYDADRDAAIARAHEQFRWFGLGWKVNADLPNPDSFERATQFVTPDDVAEQIACGPDVDEHIEKIKPYIEAGYTEIALVQIGADEQGPFAAWAERELLPALRSL